ncbi:PepSY-associated TM helix domain-containing protein [Stagnihabitans tardus]|uniref:PepSY domain-containing protein n=1 Tax=Stagnihabitans tardus TaxID=2699202 RepID=A0AAE4Y801_9RHOB|nr:PepSY-associated TM helix domain-containing protein [Stagnihabitans tardus]NBZ87523.1 hypothetical protein [Stagnihabitans tardus]
MWHRRIKTLHGWLGLFAWPWVVMIALTGLYQNHASAIDPFLPGAPLTEAQLSALPASPVTEVEASALLTEPEPVTVFGRPGWQGADGRGIDQATGVRWEPGPWMTLWRDRGGEVIAWRVEWQKLFLRLHRAGWAGENLGTWPADLVALALTLFGLSGLWLFLAPRLRRWRR